MNIRIINDSMLSFRDTCSNSSRFWIIFKSIITDIINIDMSTGSIAFL